MSSRTKGRPDVRLAETWDRIWEIEREYDAGFGFDLELWRAIDDELAELPGPLTILDVAGGRGEFLWWLRKHGRTDVLWSTLADFSRVAVEEARRARRVDEYHVVDVREAAAEITDEYDVVVGIDFLEVIDAEELPKTMIELKQLVAPRSGRLVLAGATEEHWQQRQLFAERGLVRLMIDAGVAVLRSTTVENHGLVVGRRI